MIKVLFLIHDLGQGGAEKVLVNLVNNMDRAQFDISVTVLFGGGVNEQFLHPDIHFRTVFPRAFPGNSHLMKLLTPKQLHRLFVKEHYDIEISYLEGPSARVISGCADPSTKLVSWIHCTMQSPETFAGGFRSREEAEACYRRFHQHVFVAERVKQSFSALLPGLASGCILYNTNESEKIIQQSREAAPVTFSQGEFALCAMGKLVPVKGFDRLLRVHKRLLDAGFPVHTYILGEGNQRAALEQYIGEHSLAPSVSLLGYRTNPYPVIAGCDLFVCSSYSEGFSTAATEALIVGTPVCTTDVSGMKEMLGADNLWGIVTENDEDALYRAIRQLAENPALLDHYREKAVARGLFFSTESTVQAVENMLLQL